VFLAKRLACARLYRACHLYRHPEGFVASPVIPSIRTVIYWQPCKKASGKHHQRPRRHARCSVGGGYAGSGDYVHQSGRPTARSRCLHASGAACVRGRPLPWVRAGCSTGAAPRAQGDERRVRMVGAGGGSTGEEAAPVRWSGRSDTARADGMSARGALERARVPLPVFIYAYFAQQ
jgi:hypothetical protein